MGRKVRPTFFSATGTVAVARFEALPYSAPSPWIMPGNRNQSAPTMPREPTQKTFKEKLAENSDRFDYADCPDLSRDTGVSVRTPDYLQPNSPEDLERQERQERQERRMQEIMESVSEQDTGKR
jgi:hypothetical protein